MKLRILTLGAIALMLLSGADGCPKETTTTPPPDHVLSVRAWAEPMSGQLLIEFVGFATDSKGKPAAMAKDPRFPYNGPVRNPFTHNLSYTPGINLTVSITVIAPNTQTVVGCEIIDRGISITNKYIPVEVSKKGTVITCGPYTTAS